MKRTPVASENLSSVGYESTTATLEVEFRSGRVYEYHPVPEDVYRELMRAPSLGSFFYHRIRGRYRFRRLV